MDDQPEKFSPKTSTAQPLALILLGLLFLAAALSIPLPQTPPPARARPLAEKVPAVKPPNVGSSLEERYGELSDGKAIVEKKVFTSSEVTPESEHSEIHAEGEAKQKKLAYKLGLKDVTGRGSVRASNVKVGVDYKVSKNAAVGVEASQGIHDTQDAAAWGGAADDETAVHAKCKLSF